MAEFELKALITGVDRLSPALSKMQKKIRGFKRQAEEASQGGLALGGGLAAGLTLSLKSYADQENAATGLKVAMMDANGEVGKSFQDINKLAIGLGNQLPGTTADFQNMMQMLVRQGIPAENILGGSVALRLRQVTCCFFVMLPIVTVNVSDPKYLQTSALSRRRYCSVCPLVSGLLTESA